MKKLIIVTLIRQLLNILKISWLPIYKPKRKNKVYKISKNYIKTKYFNAPTAKKIAFLLKYK